MNHGEVTTEQFAWPAAVFDSVQVESEVRPSSRLNESIEDHREVSGEPGVHGFRSTRMRDRPGDRPPRSRSSSPLEGSRHRLTSPRV